MSSRGDQLTPREHTYIRAVLAYASGSLLKATEEWCTMLVDYPLGKTMTPITSIISHINLLVRANTAKDSDG